MLHDIALYKFNIHNHIHIHGHTRTYLIVIFFKFQSLYTDVCRFP